MKKGLVRSVVIAALMVGFFVNSSHANSTTLSKGEMQSISGGIQIIHGQVCSFADNPCIGVANNCSGGDFCVPSIGTCSGYTPDHGLEYDAGWPRCQCGVTGDECTDMQESVPCKWETVCSCEKWLEIWPVTLYKCDVIGMVAIQSVNWCAP